MTPAEAMALVFAGMLVASALVLVALILAAKQQLNTSDDEEKYNDNSK